MPVVEETIAGVRARIASLTADAAAAGIRNPSIALVPTMGALHSGHVALVRRARERADVVVVSIFVNPLQFGDARDLHRYPRTLDADAQLLAVEGVAVIFAPDAEVMYPAGQAQTRVVAGDVGSLYEGRSRRGHFDGVLTVVAKLLHIVDPDVVVFGEKDAQQLFLVRRMIADLDFPVTVEAVETVRESDGLAISSRNRFLDDRQRRAARSLSRAMEAAESSSDRGPGAAIIAAQSVLTGDPAVELDYLAIAHPMTFLPVEEGYRGTAVVLVAARVGETRLIDTTTVHLA